MSLDKFEIDLLVKQERYYRDTLQWDKLRALWHPDAEKTHIDISWIQGDISDFIRKGSALARSGMSSFHVLQPLEIIVQDDRALAVTMNQLFLRMTHDGVEYDVDSWVHQLQLFEKVSSPSSGEGPGSGSEERPPQWRFRSFEAIYLRDRLVPSYPQKGAEENMAKLEAVVATAREPIRWLTWQMGLAGFKVRDDIPAYDDEKTWKPVMDRHHRWVETGDEKFIGASE